MVVVTEKSHEHNDEVNVFTHQNGSKSVKPEQEQVHAENPENEVFVARQQQKRAVISGKKKKSNKGSKDRSTADVAHGTFEHILNSCCACWKGRDEIKSSPSIFDDEFDVVPPPVKLADTSIISAIKKGGKKEKPAPQRSDPLSEPSNPRFSNDPDAGTFVNRKNSGSLRHHSGGHKNTVFTGSTSPLFGRYHNKPQVPDQPESDFTFGTSPEPSQQITLTASVAHFGTGSSGSAVPGQALEHPIMIATSEEDDKDVFGNVELVKSEAKQADAREQPVQEPVTPTRSFTDIILRHGDRKSVV